MGTKNKNHQKKVPLSKLKKKENTVTLLHKVVGPLPEDRMDTLLWGWKTSPSSYSSSSLSASPLDSTKPKSISLDSKIWSDILSSRLSIPLPIDDLDRKKPSESLNLSSSPSPSTSAKIKFSQISQNAKRLLVFNRSYQDKKSEKQASITRIREKILPTTIALDLLGFSTEMEQLRDLFLNRHGCLDNLSAEELEIIEKDAELLGRHANQSKLIDPVDATRSIARHLRAIWEIIYFRASGGIELPPVPFENMSEEVLETLPSLVLKDSIQGFGQYCSDPESEEEEEEEEEEESMELQNEEDEEENLLVEESQTEPIDEAEQKRSSYIGLPAEDADDILETPRWTFTSESVEDYLKRREDDQKLSVSKISFTGTNSLTSSNKPPLSSHRRPSLPQIRESRSNINDEDSEESEESENNQFHEIFDINEKDDQLSNINNTDLPPRMLSAVISNNTRGSSTLLSQPLSPRRSPTIYQKGYLHKMNQRTGTEFRNSSGHIAPPPMFQPVSPQHPRPSTIVTTDLPSSSPDKVSSNKRSTLLKPVVPSPAEAFVPHVAESISPTLASRPIVDSHLVPEHNSPVNSMFEMSQDTTLQVLKDQDVTLHPPNPVTLPTTGDGTPYKPYLNIWHPEELGPSSYHFLVVLPYDLVDTKNDQDIPKIVSYLPPLLHWKNKARNVHPPPPVVFIDPIDSPSPYPPEPVSVEAQTPQVQQDRSRSTSPHPIQYASIPVYDINSSVQLNQSYDWMELYQERMLTPHLPTHECDVPYLYHNIAPGQRQGQGRGQIQPQSLTLDLDNHNYDHVKDPNIYEDNAIPHDDDSRSLSLGTKDYDDEISKNIHHQFLQLHEGQFLVEGMKTNIGIKPTISDQLLSHKITPPQGYIYRYYTNTSASKSVDQSQTKRFISLPMHSKGNDFNEFYYDHLKQHFCYQSIRNNTLVHDLSIPFHDIIATQSIFENMVTLRYTGKDVFPSTSIDYLTTIPIDDWKNILFQQKYTHQQQQQNNEVEKNNHHSNNGVKNENSNEIISPRHVNIPRNEMEDDLITDSLTRSIALSSVMTPSINKDIYMKDDDDNDLAKHFNYMHDQYLHTSSLTVDTNPISTSAAEIYDPHHPPPSYSSHHLESFSISINKHSPDIPFQPQPKSGTLIDIDDGTIDIPMNSKRQIYRTYAPSGSYHVMSSLTPNQDIPKGYIPPPSSAPINGSPRRKTSLQNLEEFIDVPSSTAPHRIPIRPKTESSSRARKYNHSKLMRSHRPATVRNENTHPTPPTSPTPLKMNIPTVTPLLQATSHISSLSSTTTTMSQRIQLNNKLRYRSQTSESSSPTRPTTTGSSRRPHSTPNSKGGGTTQRSKMNPPRVVTTIPGVNLPNAVYGIDTNDQGIVESQCKTVLSTSTTSSPPSSMVQNTTNDDHEKSLFPFFDLPHRVTFVEREGNGELEDSGSLLNYPTKTDYNDDEESSLNNLSTYQMTISL